MNKRRVCSAVIIFLICAFVGGVKAQNQTGTLEITGVPTEAAAGRYDRETGVFFADVSEIEGALISVKQEDILIVGKIMEWRVDDNYLFFQVNGRLTKDNFELTADIIEYFGEEKKLKSKDNVVVVTEDATIYADNLDYDEESDTALFTSNVKVVFSDGVLEGERFLMLLEKSELQFFGSFQGEFNSEDNNE